MILYGLTGWNIGDPAISLGGSVELVLSLLLLVSAAGSDFDDELTTTHPTLQVQSMLKPSLGMIPSDKLDEVLSLMPGPGPW